MRFLVAIPVYNEEKYIERVLRCTSKFADDILVVNDGSADLSSQKARAMGVEVIDHETNVGYGRSLRDAFDHAARKGYDVVITMDADMQHLPRYIPSFLWAIEDCDIVSGSRYLKELPEDTAAPAERANINRVVTGLVNCCTGYTLTDAFCGFKAYRVESIKRLDLREDGYAMPLELWVQAASRDLKVKEIPVSLIYVDSSRSFGGDLSDADKRLAHYREVIAREARRASLEGACCDPAGPGDKGR
jgi:dolichol-phosphate mannosyltransferase